MSTSSEYPEYPNANVPECSNASCSNRPLQRMVGEMEAKIKERDEAIKGLQAIITRFATLEGELNDHAQALHAQLKFDLKAWNEKEMRKPAEDGGQPKGD